MGTGAFYKYPNKDKFIKIYKLSKKRVRNEGRISIVVQKEYLHPADQSLRAYIRQLSSTERFSSGGHVDSRDYEVVINWRNGITVDCLIEYQGTILKIDGVDGYELKKAELKLRAHEQSPDEEAEETAETEWPEDEN